MGWEFKSIYKWRIVIVVSNIRKLQTLKGDLSKLKHVLPDKDLEKSDVDDISEITSISLVGLWVD